MSKQEEINAAAAEAGKSLTLDTDTIEELEDDGVLYDFTTGETYEVKRDPEEEGDHVEYLRTKQALLKAAGWIFFEPGDPTAPTQTDPPSLQHIAYHVSTGNVRAAETKIEILKYVEIAQEDIQHAYITTEKRSASRNILVEQLLEQVATAGEWARQAQALRRAEAQTPSPHEILEALQAQGIPLTMGATLNGTEAQLAQQEETPRPAGELEQPTRLESATGIELRRDERAWLRQLQEDGYKITKKQIKGVDHYALIGPEVAEERWAEDPREAIYQYNENFRWHPTISIAHGMVAPSYEEQEAYARILHAGRHVENAPVLGFRLAGPGVTGAGEGGTLRDVIAQHEVAMRTGLEWVELDYATTHLYLIEAGWVYSVQEEHGTTRRRHIWQLPGKDATANTRSAYAYPLTLAVNEEHAGRGSNVVNRMKSALRIRFEGGPAFLITVHETDSGPTFMAYCEHPETSARAKSLDALLASILEEEPPIEEKIKAKGKSLFKLGTFAAGAAQTDAGRAEAWEAKQIEQEEHRRQEAKAAAATGPITHVVTGEDFDAAFAPLFETLKRAIDGVEVDLAKLREDFNRVNADLAKLRQDIEAYIAHQDGEEAAHDQIIAMAKEVNQGAADRLEEALGDGWHLQRHGDMYAATRGSTQLVTSLSFEELADLIEQNSGR